MKKTVLLVAMVLFGFSSFASLPAEGDDTEKETQAIRQVIQSAYVDGLQNMGSIDEIEAGFHPGFNLLGVRNNMLTKFPIYSWVSSVKARKVKNPEGRPQEERLACKYKSLDVTGHAAMAKIELYQKDKKLFTDYLQLYKFEEGWRIVSKIYHRH